MAPVGGIFETPTRAGPCSRSGARLLTAALLSTLLLGSPAASAQDIYKLVDQDGSVTYSSEPPEPGEPVEVFHPPPEPLRDDIEAARERQEKIEERFDDLDQARAERAQRAAARRPNSATTIIQSNTVLVGARPWLYGAYWRGAAVAPGAPTAPGFRPPAHRPPVHRPRPPVAAPHWRATQ